MRDARFENLLEQAMGLSAATIGSNAIERAVEARRRACGGCDADAYWALVQTPDELQQLVEAVVVPETWFFRNAQAFEAMVRDALLPRLCADPAAVVRLLSLPCSTGEEAYTMAMALLDAGVPGRRFTIDAMDISRHAIEQAQAGVYGRNSFRGHDLGFRDRHFEATPHGWRLRDEVRAPVRFVHGNIFAPGALAQGAPFDVIFCRNLLIYFDPARQKQAIGVLARMLAPEGMLFVGHSEAGLMRSEGFVPAGMAMSFSFRRAPLPADGAGQPAALPSVRKAGRGSAPPPPSPPRFAGPDRRVMPARDKGELRLLRQPPRPGAPDLATLRRMADDGRLDEAERGCQAHMRENGASAEALLLLALISDALGQGKAAAHHYRKVLYLDPANPEALGHLALLLRREGDVVGAQRLDDRLRRRGERRG